MKKDVLKYGLLSGFTVAILMALTVPFEHHIKASYGMAVGYTIMVLSFLIVFVGVKHYRDTECGGGRRVCRRRGCSESSRCSR